MRNTKRRLEVSYTKGKDSDMSMSRLASIISGSLIMYLRFVLFFFGLLIPGSILLCQSGSDLSERQELVISRLQKEIDFDGYPSGRGLDFH